MRSHGQLMELGNQQVGEEEEEKSLKTCRCLHNNDRHPLAAMLASIKHPEHNRTNEHNTILPNPADILSSSADLTRRGLVV